MLDSDKREFYELLKIALLTKNGSSEDEIIIFWFDLFVDYSIDAFKEALKRAVKESRGRLEPSKVTAYLPDPLGHPSAEEAWNACPKTEQDTAYVTDEIMAALAACDDSLQRGDLVAARMAFTEVYRQQLATAKVLKKRARFWMTYATGLDADEKRMAKEQAVFSAQARGWITSKQAQREILQLTDTRKDQKAIGNLTQSKITDPKVARRRIKNIKDMLKGCAE